MPAQIGRYRVERMLGRGAMGVIYQAHDPDIDRRVAIKLIRADLLEGDEKQDFIERFRREAQAAGRVVHPNIVAIYDFAMHDGNPFLAMELVEGISLAMALHQNGRFASDDAVAMMVQVLDALDCAHGAGVVHRDVKPANILLTAGNRVKITDFGIARFDGANLTQHGAMVGTPSYMSPEQCMGETVDARTDVFSAGAVLYEMLAGARPFQGRTSTEVTYRLMNDSPPDLVVPGVPPALAAAALRAMAKQPAQRFASAAAMAEALRGARAPALAPDATVVMRPAAAAVQAAPRTRISPAEAERATDALAQHVGPIARVLVKRAVARAASPAALREMLAAEIGDAADRATFLREARKR